MKITETEAIKKLTDFMTHCDMDELACLVSHCITDEEVQVDDSAVFKDGQRQATAIVNGRWEAQHRTEMQGWINCWREDGKPLQFETEAAARKALIEHFSMLDDAVQHGELLPYTIEDYRVAPVLPTKG